MSKKKKIIIAVVVVLIAEMAFWIYLVNRNPDKYYNGNGEKISMEQYVKIREELNTYETEITINDKTFNFGTTLREILDSGAEIEESDNLDAILNEESNVFNLKLKGSKDVMLGFIGNTGSITAEETVFNSIVGGTDIYVEGMKFDIEKTTIKDMLDNGWELEAYKPDRDQDNEEENFGYAYFSKDGKDIQVEFAIKTGNDIKTAVIISLDS